MQRESDLRRLFRDVLHAEKYLTKDLANEILFTHGIELAINFDSDGNVIDWWTL